MNNKGNYLKTVLGIVGLIILSAIALSFFRGQVGSAAQELDATPTVERALAPGDALAEPLAVPTERSYNIVTLLPPDAIPAIDNPRFYSAAEADAEYDPDELVMGVTINGESKAYSTSHLDSHEIVNDTLGGRKIAVTW